MNEELPSINDFTEELPSYKDFIDPIEESVAEEVTEEVVSPPVIDNTEVIVSLIESVRESIPEVKSYDKELYELMHLIGDVRKEIPVVPEPPVIPEVRYYDEQISNLQESIQEVKDRDIPDFRWISKSFSVINEDFDNLSDTLATLKGRLDLEVNEIVESIETSNFEKNVDVKRLDESITSTKEEITSNLSEVKEKIYEQLRDASLRIWNLNKEFKADDKALKKKIDEEYKALSISIDEVFEHSKGNHEIATAYFEDLKEEIRSLPEVKYYDEQINEVNKSISSVRNLVEVLENKLNKKIKGLKESILVVPPTENNLCYTR